MQEEFWKKKKLSELTDEEWEALCDGCGRCCYRKYLSGRGRKEKLFYTKVACDFLDLKTNRCTVYENRFSESPDCEKLTKEKLASSSWLPDSCAYRLLKEGRELEAWHPLISKNKDSVKRAGICIRGGIHECDCDDWMNYVLHAEKRS